MPVLNILRYPDPILREKAYKVREINRDIERLIDDMVAIMYSSPAIGLAAPQVGQRLRIIVIDVSTKTKGAGLLTLINPKIIRSEGEKIVREGCLSLPEYTANVKRAEKVIAKGLDRGGNDLTINSQGLEAIALQHEIDHLDGILFIDRVSSLKTDLFRRKR